ncbi:MAG TPA: zinc-ribbon domain-containing protein [Pyrinomonadaceae bacterium]
MKATGTQATPEVIESWVEVFNLFQECTGERRERLQQIAERLGITYKIARRRLRNYESMHKLPTSMPPSTRPAEATRTPGKKPTATAAAPADGTDQQLMCADCRQEFTWSAGEQEYYRQKGFEPPRRCKPCREAKKARTMR